MMARDFAPGFKVAHQSKDLRLAVEAAGALGYEGPGTALARRLFRELEAAGLGAEGTQALVKAIERLADVEVR
jgi:3-hydroxyisobutyrate dehydrogenase-like beta-hydroxyacid dehydrogenase